MTKQERKEKFRKFRPYIQVAITGVVELFTGAISNFVLDHVEGGKPTKLGVRVGGGLVGLMVGDKVSDYICDGVEEFIDNMEEIKEAIDEAKEEE